MWIRLFSGRGEAAYLHSRDFNLSDKILYKNLEGQKRHIENMYVHARCSNKKKSVIFLRQNLWKPPKLQISFIYPAYDISVQFSLLQYPNLHLGRQHNCNKKKKITSTYIFLH